MNEAKIETVREYFLQLQADLIASLESLDKTGKFSNEYVETPNGGFSQPRVLKDGALFEKAAVHFTYSVGPSLPAAATDKRPHLAGKPFAATALSSIVHPWNPHVPTTHINLRMFLIDSSPVTWYFGGGFDLTPYLPYVEDFTTWHKYARQACSSDSQYKQLKRRCDEYFFLSHRNETRGIGGLFFDDYVGEGFTPSLEFTKRVGSNFLSAYTTIVRRRSGESWTEEEEEWMLIRRGRYAEFNLAIDRGTKYGLQSGRRIESVLASLPPRVKWVYGFEPPASSKQEQLLQYLRPNIEWLRVVDNSVDYECEE